MSRLVVPGVDPADQRTSWEVLRRNGWWWRYQRGYRPHPQRADRGKARGIAITEAGRAYLAEMRHAALNAAGGA